MHIQQWLARGKHWLAGLGLVLVSGLVAAAPTPLQWDDNANTSESVSQPDTVGGDYIYVIGPETAAHGVWRTVLTVTSGEADLHVKQGDPLVVGTGVLSSNKVGSDAVLIDQPSYSVGQGWYIRVSAQPGATWTLTSGDIDVADWGAVDTTTDTSTATIGPEGMLWFKVIMDPAQVQAWGIMEKSATPKAMYVSRGQAPMLWPPLSKKIADQKEETRGQMVATSTGQTATYYLGVAGNVGSTVNLTAFKHNVIVPSTLPPGEYTDEGPDDFAFSLTGQSSTAINTGSKAGFRYVTYQVNVPANGLGWQVKMTPAVGDTADLYLRYGRAATPNDNHAMSELAGQIIDNAIIVPPDLNVGVSYITVYSANDDDFTFDLKSGDPQVTPVPYINEAPSQIVNAPGNQNMGGWVYYRVDNVPEQLNYMGWELLLSQQTAGSELAIRRNAIPAYGKYRSNGLDTTGSKRADISSTSGILQDPNHQADIWYIGVYNPTVALGAFELVTRAPQQSTLGFNGGTSAVGSPTCDATTGQSVGAVRYYQVTVPAGGLGWDVRLSNVTGTGVKMFVRRDLLPNLNGAGGGNNGSDHWDSGINFYIYGDYTGDSNPDGSSADGQRFTVGMNNPLEPGTYYIGVGVSYPPASGFICYSITSRAIGIGNDGGGNPYAIQVQDVPFNGGSASATLPSREIAVYRINVPANMPGWMLKLEPDAGQEAMLAVGHNRIPNSAANESNSSEAINNFNGTTRENAGNDYFYRFASYNQTTSTDEQFLAPATYYAVVESEGAGRVPYDRVAAGSAHFTLTSAVMPYTDTSANPLDEGELKSWTGKSLPYGEYHLYRVRPAAGLAAMDIRLKNRVGKPRILVEKAATDVFRFPNEYSSGCNANITLSQDRSLTRSGYGCDFSTQTW